MIVEFNIGDWSGDGHGYNDTYYASISGFFTLEAVKEAYFKGKADLGFGIENICSEYQSWSIDESQWETLLEDGYVYFRQGDIDDHGMDAQTYLHIFEYIVNKHMPEFKAEMHYPSRYPELWGWQGQIFKEYVGYGIMGP